MRVGLVITGGADRSGRERVIPVLLWMIERIARLHDLHVFVLHHEPAPATYRLLGATVHDLGRAPALPGLGCPIQRRRLRRAIARIGGVDVLHGYWGLPGSVAVAVAQQLKIPSIVTANSGEWVALPDIGYGLQRRWRDRRAVAAAMRGATVVTVCTTFMQQLAAQHGVPARVMPFGVPRDILATRSIGDIDGPPWRLLHVASINPVKDHETLLRAMAIVVDHLPGVHLDIVGADTMGGHVQRLAGQLNLSANITFHGFLPTEAIAPLWQRADLHLVTSRHEAAGVVVLEAAMAGVPTVGTRVGYVADGAPHRAVAVDVGDAQGLASAIIDLINDPARRAVLAATARTWAISHDADHATSMLDRLYREVTNV